MKYNCVFILVRICISTVEKSKNLSQSEVKFHRLAVDCEYNFHMLKYFPQNILMHYEVIAVQHHLHITGNESNKAILA